MRASRRPDNGDFRGEQKGRGSEIHISGAEGLFEESECGRAIRRFFQRALRHARGRPDTVVITCERIRTAPLRAPLLEVSTLPCADVALAAASVRDIIRGLGVSARALDAAVKIITANRTMRGASLVDAGTGGRREPDRERGVRVSRLGIERDSERRLGRRLSRDGINTARVREALALASKVASCEGVLAEICISDDPDYTTGYVASRDIGYVRVPNIKREGAMHGGRVFFIRRGVSADDVIEYLERTPVVLFLPKNTRTGKAF